MLTLLYMCTDLPARTRARAVTLTIKQMGDDEIMSQLSQGSISNQPRLTKDVLNEGSVRDFEESSSSVIKSTLYD